jgi:hypothetical protein
MAPPKKSRGGHRPTSHRAGGHRHGAHRRNADSIPDDILLTPAPILAPPTQSMMPYAMVPASASRPRPSRAGRAAGSVRRKAAAMAHAMKPEAATITKEHLLGVGANAAGGIATALAANELVDNVGVMPMAIGATVVGGLGSAFLKGNWQKVAQGVLGAGVGQLGTAYLTERALKKAAAAQKAATPAASSPSGASAAKRNASSSGLDENDLVRAMERTERRLDALLDDERNAYDAGLEADEYAVAM